MLKNFIEEIAAQNLCRQDDKILLAVSGGVDSMVMAHLFQEAGYAFGVAHCNFQLRGNESDKDESFVNMWCAEFKIPFHSKRFSTKNYAAENGISIQMAARELRYSWFTELLDGQGYSLLATAHHLDDNLETTLLNLVRGTGLSGLRGIPVKANRIIRPLLNFTKEEIVVWAKENNVAWREDISNESDEYDRNFVRHEVISKLIQLNPSLKISFRKTNQRLRGAEALFQLGLDAMKEDFLVIQDEKVKLDKAFLLVTKHPTAVAWELVKDYGFNYSQCQDMVRASEGISGKSFTSSSHELTIDRHTWIIESHQEKVSEVTIAKTDNEVKLGSLEMSIEKTTLKSLANDPLIATLDAEKAKFPMTWRVWEKGDSFIPLGMDNRKKLSDFFIDRKIPLAYKKTATVVEINGEIAWVVGHRIDNRFKVTDQTREIIRLTLQPHL